MKNKRLIVQVKTGFSRDQLFRDPSSLDLVCIQVLFSYSCWTTFQNLIQLHLDHILSHAMQVQNRYNPFCHEHSLVRIHSLFEPKIIQVQRKWHMWSMILTLYASRFFFSPSNSPVMFTPRSTLLFSEKFFSYKFWLVYFFLSQKT